MKRTRPHSRTSSRAPRSARPVIAALALVLAGLVLAIPVAGASSTQVWVTGGNDCSHERYQPAQIVIACTDGTEMLKGLKWSRWNGREATGTGRDYVVSCTPDCAAGHRSVYPVTVTLTKPATCPGQAHRAFSRAELRFGKAHPGSKKTETDRLGCPL
jgi:hypothetical protein